MLDRLHPDCFEHKCVCSLEARGIGCAAGSPSCSGGHPAGRTAPAAPRSDNAGLQFKLSENDFLKRFIERNLNLNTRAGGDAEVRQRTLSSNVDTCHSCEDHESMEVESKSFHHSFDAGNREDCSGKLPGIST